MLSLYLQGVHASVVCYLEFVFQLFFLFFFIFKLVDQLERASCGSYI